MFLLMRPQVKPFLLTDRKYPRITVTGETGFFYKSSYLFLDFLYRILKHAAYTVETIMEGR